MLMSQADIFQDIIDAIVHLDEEKAINLANTAINKNMNFMIWWLII